MTPLAVAMSGGVDSAVAAILLARSGRARVAFTMRLSDAPGGGAGRCCAARDIKDARRVAEREGLAHHVLDLRQEFDRKVIAPFVESYLGGATPIPCVACNDALKFEDLVTRARSLGAEGVATGHYARLERDGERVRLLRARDASRDQSYFLHGLSQEQLRAAEFPLGEMTKDEVRAFARAEGVAVADKPDSQEICFVPDGDVGAFVEREASARGFVTREGTFVTAEGKSVGAHAGVHRFTVGQRRGLGAHGAARHVIEIRADTAEVVIGAANELLFDSATIAPFRWVSGRKPSVPVEALVQVRHGREAVRALVVPQEGGARFEFDAPHRAVARGQFGVAYDGDEVLGGGPITSAHRIV